MKFRNSIYEEQLNQLWNKYIVPIDTAIRQKLKGDDEAFMISKGIQKLIGVYQVNVRYILAKLKEYNIHFKFEDKDYLKQYYLETESTCKEDIAYYNKQLEARSGNGDHLAPPSGTYDPKAFYQAFFSSKIISTDITDAMVAMEEKYSF